MSIRPGAAKGAGVGVDRLERVRRLEELKAQLAAMQAAEVAAFVAERRAEQSRSGLSADRVGRGVAAEVALALRVSPHQAQRYCGWATILTSELPETFAALGAGRTTEWRAMLVARETIWLSRAHREAVDRELAPRLHELGNRQVEAEAKKIAYRLDPAGFTERSRNAAADRRVSLRPAPDTMCRLSALLPVVQGVAAYAALSKAAAASSAAGDGRARGQVMADTLVERVTGQTAADHVPVEVELIMSDETLLGASREPALVGAAGVAVNPLPAPLARELLLGTDAPVWLRRLFRAPSSGELAALETRRRLFTEGQRRFLRLRDQGMCRTPFCGAPIRHYDHVVAAEHGGVTTVANGQGLCVACNLAKQAPGWHSSVRRGRVTITTPTRHTYRHRPPDPARRRDVPAVAVVCVA